MAAESSGSDDSETDDPPASHAVLAGRRFLDREHGLRCTVVGLREDDGAWRAHVQYEDGVPWDHPADALSEERGFDRLADPEDPPLLDDACADGDHRFEPSIEPRALGESGFYPYNAYSARCRDCSLSAATAFEELDHDQPAEERHAATEEH